MSDKVQSLRDLSGIAREMGVPDGAFHPYGPGRGKIDPRFVGEEGKKKARYILVSGMTPTPAGEGKTTTSIGLAMGLTRLGLRSVVTLRQPSMGPVFGIKGGGAGGGRSTVEPSSVLNLHLTGDIHAVAAAHNLLAAAIDNSLHHGNPLGIDALAVSWGRVVDLNDRALRRVVVGLGGPGFGIPRESRFEIAVASEIMAILALSVSWEDLARRISSVTFGRTREGKPLTAADLRVDGAMTALLREALWPNLMQTCEGTPAIVHGSPFANIAHGNSSVLGDRVALATADCVVTEAGFGSDLGGEKFFDIKCRVLGRGPDVAVLVVTARGLRMHGGVGDVRQGRALPAELARPNLPALVAGLPNMVRHVGILRQFGVPVVVAINSGEGDSDAEIGAIREAAVGAGARDAVVSTHFRDGGEGARGLASAVCEAATGGKAEYRPLYPLEMPLREKVETVATRIYGAGSVVWSDGAKAELARIEKTDAARFPVCIAKTWASLSHDPSLKNAPEGFAFPVRELRVLSGAGFVLAIAGETQTMPGLPSDPAFARIGLTAEGEIAGIL
ncbi:MAG: formate--tetrahydrofolate ligase [Leptospirillia bacterium]